MAVVRILFPVITAILALGQAASDTDPSVEAQRVVRLALDGRCNEALPGLRKAQTSKLDAETARLAGKAGVRCSMMLGEQAEAIAFLGRLQREFPKDPDVLFLAVRVYSDLAQINSQALLSAAPDSIEVVQLNAENFEKRGDLEKAIAEYRILLQRAPATPGIHYRIGGLLLNLPPAPDTSDQARKEFEEELKIYPRNAGAEYYLGELARQADKLPEAIEHFAHATQYTPGFAEAYLGLGRSLFDSGRASDAVAPLETAAKLAPDNPNVHFALAASYQRLGRKDDAAREFALQKTTAGKLNQNTKELRKNVSGATGNAKQ